LLREKEWLKTNEYLEDYGWAGEGVDVYEAAHVILSYNLGMLVEWEDMVVSTNFSKYTSWPKMYC
jgi:hypothetical protein